jgi:cytochrome c oxidase subunit 2
MASVDSPVTSPVAPQPPGWARRFPLDERVFMWVILVLGAVMAAISLAWLFAGDRNVPTTSYTTSPEAWSQRVSAWAAKHTDARGRVVVPPGEDGYIMAARYAFFPDPIVIKAGVATRLWISSVDNLHGYSIVGGGQNLNLEIAPKHAVAMTITPDKPGTYLVVCNEYCGLGHHGMKGHIVVER